MNELPPSHPTQPPPQTRGLAAPYSLSTTAMAANVVNLDRKSFQGVPRAVGVNLSAAKYQVHQQQQVLQVNEYHAGAYATASYPHLKTPADRNPVGHNANKFEYTPSQQYSSHVPQQQQQQQQQSYAAAYGYSSYAQNYGTAPDYQQQQQQTQQQQYHGGYAQTGDTNALGMLVSSATNPQAPPEAMPHEPVNIGLKDADRKFRQPFGVMANDSFLSSSGSYGATVERPGNVVQIKSTPHNSQQQQQPMYQRPGMYSGPAYYSQQRTQQTSQQHNPLDLVPPGGSLGANFETSANGGIGSTMARGMSGGAMFSAGPRMPQFSPGSSGPALTTRLKEGDVDITAGTSSNGSHFVQQQPATKPLEIAHPTPLYAEVASSTSSMSMVSLSSDGPAAPAANAPALYPPSLAPPATQLSANSNEVCGLCGNGAHCDRIASHCGHRFHNSCLQSWGGMTTCPICVQASNSITSVPHAAPVSYSLGADNVPVAGVPQGSPGQGDMALSGVGNNNNGNVTNAGSLSISPNSVGSSQITGINSLQASNLQVNNNVSSARPPPIDTRLVDGRVGPTSLSGGKRSATSTRSSSSGSGRTRKNKKLKDCSVPGCDRTVRSRGLCKGHGGGRRCGFAGCGLSDQGGGFCISHGGGKRCQHEGCDNSAQSRGLCKLHGGGSRCTIPNCTKSSQGRGLCRAHGGGRRCMVEGCNKTDRRAGYCVTHGADKKCIIPECSKTGRIDNMCTKHYFERHPAQPPGSVNMTPPPVITINANSAAAKARAERKKAAASYADTSSVMPAASTTNPPFAGDGQMDGAIVKNSPF